MKSAGDGFTLLGRVVGRQVALRFLNRPRCFQAPLVEDASLAAEPGPTVSALKVCASAGPREADRTATPELAMPGSPACAQERSC